MDLEKMSLVELRALGKEKGVKSVTTLKKGELIERIRAAMGEVPEQVQSVESAPKGSKSSAKPSKKTGAKKSEIESQKAEKESPIAEIKSPKTDSEPAKSEIEFSQIEIESKQIQTENNSEFKSKSEPAAQVTEPGNNEKNTGNASKIEPSKTERFPRTDTNKTDNKYNKSAARTDLSKSDNTRRDSQRNETGYRNDNGGRTDNYNRADNYNRTDNYRQQMNRNQMNRQDASPMRADNRPDNSRPDSVRTEAPKTLEQPKNDTTKNDYFKQPDEGNPSNGTTLDSGEIANGILEVLPDGYGFIRCANYLPGDNDIYVAPSMIRRFNLKTGDILNGNIRVKTQGEKFSALLYVSNVNGYHPAEAAKRIAFEELTPIFPNERIKLEKPGSSISMRIVDLLSPIGKGQRGMIVSPPKTGKTTLLKEIAKSISNSYPDIQLIVLLIDERPEEVTDIKESIAGSNVEVIYSTFDELPEHHKRVSEMVLERAKRLVEHKKDVVILLDSITRLARAYNLTVPPSGRTLTGGLDPAALHMPKKFFGAARNMREGGSLTVLATALVETGSKMDDVVFEEFKGTGNMELVLDRKLSEKRIFPAIDIPKSGTRRDDLLLTPQEQEVVYAMHKEMSTGRAEDTLDEILKLFIKTRNNTEFLQIVRKSLLR